MNELVDPPSFDHASVVAGAATLLERTARAVTTLDHPIAVYRNAEGLHDPVILSDASAHVDSREGCTLHALLPPVYPEWLGDRTFNEVHGARFAYVAGEMARGIASTRMVVAAVRAGFVGFFGSAGLSLAEIDGALLEISDALGPDAAAWGANLIHSPDQPGLERNVVELFLRRRVHRVSASAFMRMSPDIVHYAAAGLRRGRDGLVIRDTHVFAKISRPEVARHFISPAPPDMLRELVAAGRIGVDQADMASMVPVAEDVTVEGDSGGHTDNRPISVLFPVIAHLSSEIATQKLYRQPVRLGIAGGLGTPSALAGAFQQGAAYVLIGSVNQCTIEADVSPAARAMLAQADLADVMMAPAADMFEMGVKVQVLKRGTMFAVKGQRLYELYRRYDSLEALPQKDIDWLESQVLRTSVANGWSACRDYLAAANPPLLERADREPKLRMAMLFRSYLFHGAQWAREGVEDRRTDYQIWCGPAIGAFNDWVRGSFLEALDRRTIAAVGLNLLTGACIATRAHQLRTAGVHVPPEFYSFRPKPIGPERDLA